MQASRLQAKEAVLRTASFFRFVHIHPSLVCPLKTHHGA